MKEHLRETTRAAILDAAERVYVREGFEGGRMEQVAEAAGVSVGTLYNYFADRSALVDSLLQDRRAELLRRIDEAVTAAADEPVARLRAIGRSTLGHVEAHREFVSLLLQERASECGIGKTSMVASPSTTVLGIQGRTRTVLERAREQGRLPGGDPILLSHLFTGFLRAGILYKLDPATDPKATGADALADHVLETFLKGVAFA